MKKFASWDDVYAPKPGDVKEARCGVCNAEMEVERNTFRQAGFRGHLPADVFTCPNKTAPWHSQLKALWRIYNDCPSARLAEILEQEMLEIRLNPVNTTNKGN
jgi:hypothetical protein